MAVAESCPVTTLPFSAAATSQADLDCPLCGNLWMIGQSREGRVNPSHIFPGNILAKLFEAYRIDVQQIHLRFSTKNDLSHVWRDILR